MLRIPTELAFTQVQQLLALPSVPFSERRGLPDRPGVYFAFVDGLVAYVGCTGLSIRARWLHHHRARDLMRFGDLTIGYLPCDDHCLAAMLEAYLIDTFQPPFNDRSARAVEVHVVEGRKVLRALPIRWGQLDRGKSFRHLYDDESWPPNQTTPFYHGPTKADQRRRRPG